MVPPAADRFRGNKRCAPGTGVWLSRAAHRAQHGPDLEALESRSRRLEVFSLPVRPSLSDFAVPPTQTKMLDCLVVLVRAGCALRLSMYASALRNRSFPNAPLPSAFR